MYRDETTDFGTHQFSAFKQMVECRHEQIHVKWDVDMNVSGEVLAFTLGSKILPTKHVDEVVTKEAWINLVAEVKSECVGTCLLPIPWIIFVCNM
jgi:hypothetical protein